MSEIVIIVALLLACLVALILVLIARREAAATREQATTDAAVIKAEARAMMADAQTREARVGEREKEIAAERRQVHELAQAAERAEADRAEARRVLTAAEIEAERTLASVTGLSMDDAVAEQTRRAVAKAGAAAAATVRREEVKARKKADARAREIITTAVQRLAGPTSAQSVVTVLPLPAEEMKGRIIGKEGRNIRTFEAVTGVNVLIDDTSDSVTLSCFDPERREVAAVAMAALIEDGRIHPQRIELAYAEALAGAPSRATGAGHDAAERAGVTGLAPELIDTLGRLRLRVGYGQNVLEHLVECAQIAAAMAAELGANVDVARRAAFLHDVGKALTADRSGTHAALGAELVRRCGEPEVVANAVAAHHDEVPMESLEAVIVQAADTCSAARPGARREEVDHYLERMTTLESMVAKQSGVARVVAMSAGRDVRVVVEPDSVGDEALPALAEGIARHIETELRYPGEVTVTVIRELRATATTG